MSRRVGLRLAPVREGDELDDDALRLDVEPGDPDAELGDGGAQPPVLGATPAATPSR
jgi:hypothetical protein